MVIFVTEIVIFLKTSKQNESEENGFRMEEFQKYFFFHMYTVRKSFRVSY